MMSLSLPRDLNQSAAHFLRGRRLMRNLTQAQLSEQSGVSLAVLRKFERTGKIAFESFIKLAFVLECGDAVINALKPAAQQPTSINELLAHENEPLRQRASGARKGKV